VLVLNHTLFFTLLGGIEEAIEGGILFKNDFVIFDEAHQLESVASRHIGCRVSSAQVRYTLHRLWNPRTEKGLLATLRKGSAVRLVADLLSAADGFFRRWRRPAMNCTGNSPRAVNRRDRRAVRPAGPVVDRVADSASGPGG
jgi:ATP-dependent DNA helicase DinG